MSRKKSKRQDIPLEQTWDLTCLYPDEAAYAADLARAGALTDQLLLLVESQLRNSRDPVLVLQAVKDYEQVLVLLDHAGTYASLNVSVDMTDTARNSRALSYETKAADLSSRLSALESCLMETDDALLQEAAALDPAYRMFFQDLLRKKKHRLGAEAEKVLSALQPALQLPSTAYEQAKHADMDFSTFKVRGEDWPLSFVLFENDYSLSPDREVRRGAFKAFSSVLHRYRNSIAALYNGEVQKQKTLSGLRGYASVTDYLLDGHKISRALYDRQINVIMTELAPHMRRYARLLQKAHGLDKLTFADLKIPLDPGFDPPMSMAEAAEVLPRALAVLGPAYQAGVRRAFQERWIDYAQNAGKMTGGFCASPYQVHGYILLSWTSQLSEVFTLAHELGHAMHFLLAQGNQPYLACEPSLYVVEAPSTINELFLMQDLLQQNQDPRFQRWVQASLIQNTYYHNFVTHLLEAAYQREVYRLVDAGENLQAEDFSAITRAVLGRFWGDAVEINAGAELTWMRQPHYYMGLYPYTYSAGLTIATEVHRQIRTQGQQAVDRWLQALTAGASVDPAAFAALAGVDISTEMPLCSTIAEIGRIIGRLEDS